MAKPGKPRPINNWAERIHGECIVEAVAVGARLILIDAFNAGGHEDRAVLIADGACVHALDAGLAFRAVLVGVGLRVGAKGVLEDGVKAAELGRKVGDGVVDEFVAERDDLKAAADVAPAAGECVHDVAEAGVRTVAADDRADADFAEVAGKVDAGFAAPEAAALTEGAVVGLNAAFEDEAGLVAVAEVFGALDAEAGADVLAGDHAGGGVAVAVDVLVVANGKTGVDDAVDLSVGGEGGAGGEGAGHGAAEDGMLHISSGVLRAGSARRPCPVVVLRKVEDDGGGPPEDCSLSCDPGGIRGEMPFSMRALSVRGIRPWRACGPRFGQRSPCGRRPCRWRGSGTRWRSSRRCRCR